MNPLMKPPHRRTAHRVVKAAQRGVTMLVVLLLMVAMLMGGLALARFAEVGVQVSGNVQFREQALHASEVGINSAYAAVRGMAFEEADIGTWYRATAQPQDAQGMPTGLDWNAVGPEITVGAFRVRYFVERLCQGALPIVDPEAQCLLKREELLGSRKGGELIDSPAGRQFRITVRVLGPKDTRTFVQTLVTRG
jgi:type IV pilus assembly protein PilX